MQEESVEQWVHVSVTKNVEQSCLNLLPSNSIAFQKSNKSDGNHIQRTNDQACPQLFEETKQKKQLTKGSNWSGKKNN